MILAAARRHFNHGPWHADTRAGLRVPHPRAGPAPPPRTGRCTSVNPRMLGPWRCGCTGAHASARCAGADFASCTIATGAAVGRHPKNHTRATARACVLPSNPRNGGMCPAARTADHATCGGVEGNRHGSPAGACGTAPLRSASYRSSGRCEPMRSVRTLAATTFRTATHRTSGKCTPMSYRQRADHIRLV